ncbi:MAG: thiamine phosphate synthase [Succinivibrionaceae bacterium]
MGVVLCIAATDSINGAGVTADLATVRDFGLKGVCAVTAITAQNMDGCYSIGVTEPELLSEQLEAILDSKLTVSAIKLGLIPNKKQLKIILKFIKLLKNRRTEQEEQEGNLDTVKVVWDPVSSSSSGNFLSTINYKKHLSKILPYIDVFTPNLIEAQELSEIKVDMTSVEDFQKSLQYMINYFKIMGASNIYIKGGHIVDYKEQMGKNKFDNIIIDCVKTIDSEHLVYFLNNRSYFSKRVANVHGTGCIVSSAIASMLAKGFYVLDSIAYAKAYVNQGIEQSFVLDSEQSQRYFKHKPYNNDLNLFPRMIYDLNNLHNFKFNKDDDGFEKIDDELGLYPVVDSSAWVSKLCKSGVKIVQLRIKQPKNKEFLIKEIKKSVAIGKKYKAKVFIDDYWELAIEHNAYGVHLGQEDLCTADLLKIKLAGLRLGISTHGYAEIARSLMVKPSYIALGHIFPTNSKVMPSLPQGTKRLAQYVSLLKGTYKTVAIGGIKLDNLDSVLDTEVDSVAVITAITEAENYDETIKIWLQKVNKISSDEVVTEKEKK